MFNDFLTAQNKNTPEFTQNILKLQNNFKNFPLYQSRNFSGFFILNIF